MPTKTTNPHPTRPSQDGQEPSIEIEIIVDAIFDATVSQTLEHERIRQAVAIAAASRGFRAVRLACESRTIRQSVKSMPSIYRTIGRRM